MTELSKKRHLTDDEVGLLDEGHADKKLKFSKIGEPLTKKDLKLFQKDVLYRNLKEYKRKYLALNETVALNQDVIKLREYYDLLFHELERENSEAVQRVMGKNKTTETVLSKSDSEAQASLSPAPPSVAPEELKPSDIKPEETDAKLTNDIASLKNDINDINSDIKLNNLQSQLDEVSLKLENSQKNILLKTAELEKINIKFNEQNKAFENEKLESQKLKTELDSYVSQFNKLTEEHKLLLKKLNSLQISNDTGASADIPDKFEETIKHINDSLLVDLQKLQKNLARIRSERDQLRSDNNLLTSQQKGSDIMQDIQNQISSIKEVISNFEKAYGSVTSDNDLLEELKSIELAYNLLATTKLDALNKTILDKQQMEKVLFDFEKLKEKYASMSRLLQDYKVEIEILKKIKIKGDELISDYDIRERISKGKVSNLEKQLELSREVEKFVQLNHNETLSKLNVLNKEISNLKIVVSDKDSLLDKANQEISNLKTSNKNLENNLSEINGLQSKQDKKHKNLITKLKQASEKISNPELATHVFGNAQISDINSNNNDSSLNGGNSSGLQDQLNNFKQLVYCPLCTLNFKNQMIKNCGHTFCENCIKERLNARMRKCPSCNLPFGSTDVLDIVL